MSTGPAMPEDDPAALEQYAAELDRHAADMDGHSSRTARVTASIRDNAEWTGSAADGYTAYTSNLARGVGAMQPPLAKIAAATRVYAGYLRTAQQKVGAYNDAAQLASATQHPAHVTAAQGAAHDAQLAVAEQQSAEQQAAREISEAKDGMENPFGPEGVVRQWIEKIHAPWDAVVGDAAVARALARIEEGEKIIKKAGKLQAGLAERLRRNAQEMNAFLDETEADLKTQGDEILRLLIDTEKDGSLIKAMKAGGEAMTKGAPFWRTVAAGSDVLGGVGDVYTIFKPEDGGAMGTVDRAVAGTNLALSAADVVALGAAFEVPVVGQVALVGTGLYLGGDYLYHHWTPFRNVCNSVGHATVAGVNDVAHAAASTAKDAWHGITSIF